MYTKVNQGTRGIRTDYASAYVNTRTPKQILRAMTDWIPFLVIICIIGFADSIVNVIAT